MGSLIRSFTVGRNALKRDIEQSAHAAMRGITIVREGADLSQLKANDNGTYNIVRDLISFTGIIRREGDRGVVTPVGEAFERLFRQNPTDAWRWLLTRTLWLYTVPNGTQSTVNRVAAEGSFQFDFFRRFLGLLTSLSSLPGDSAYLGFEELCRLYDQDSAWTSEPPVLLSELMALRAADPKLAASTRSFLEDLEPQYSVPRDNFAALFGKAFSQTGLFSYRRVGAKLVSIALASQLDPVLQGRVRFVLDHPQTWSGTDWEAYLGLREIDLPEQVSVQSREENQEPETPETLAGLVPSAVEAFQDAGLVFDPNLVARLTAALIAKKFVILTGLSGSGKTKLAQAFAMWISPRWVSPSVRFSVGDILPADRIEYRVAASDSISVELEGTENGTRVSLPYGLIDEWVEAIQRHGFGRDTTARAMRDVVTTASAYSTQLSSFETHLKAAALATLERSGTTSAVKNFEIVSVGPDWTSRDSSFGYVDALTEGRFVRSTPIADLVLRAISDPASPYFLILDEMNLSHVERYFSEFLSAAESGEPMFIHGHHSTIDGIPPTMIWPDNLFVIGTVNVDETTYMFSPKVLDRANTIEFRVTADGIAGYLGGTNKSVALNRLEGRGTRFSAAFVSMAKAAVSETPAISRLALELRLLFDVLENQGSEFGFRTAKEIVRFFHAYDALQHDPNEFYGPLDAQVLQKVLPRLSGSRRRLEGVLCALAVYCCHSRVWSDNLTAFVNSPEVLESAKRSSQLADPSLHPLSTTFQFLPPPVLPASFNKIRRMLIRLDAEGFASFAEA